MDSDWISRVEPRSWVAAAGTEVGGTYLLLVPTRTIATRRTGVASVLIDAEDATRANAAWFRCIKQLCFTYSYGHRHSGFLWADWGGDHGNFDPAGSCCVEGGGQMTWSSRSPRVRDKGRPSRLPCPTDPRFICCRPSEAGLGPLVFQKHFPFPLVISPTLRCLVECWRSVLPRVSWSGFVGGLILDRRRPTLWHLHSTGTSL